MSRALLRTRLLALALLALGAGRAAAQDPGSPSATLRTVETGVTAFVGVVPDDAVTAGGGRPAPARRPVQLRSWKEFVSAFADLRPPSREWSAEDAAAVRHLQLAVRGFFANGGRRAWVLRVPARSDLSDVRDELQALRELDVDLVVVPGASGRTQHEAILAHVASTADRFALLDGGPDPVREVPSEVRSTPRDSDRATLLFPWIFVRDPVSGRRLAQPPGGHVAGVLARSDRERGVHRAPGNLPVTDAAGPARSLSQSVMQTLTLDGILVLRIVSGSSGLRTWGGRTLGGQANGTFRYIHVRRTVDLVKETLWEGLGAVPCRDAASSAEAFLREMWRDGALQGARPSEAFFVRCDRAGDALRVGLALERPAEFIALTIDLR